MKTLYISDLDGTLFNKSKKISIFTADVINKCIEEGMLFSVATARMPYGCDYRLKDIHMTIPGILTNGVFLYDFKNEKYVSVENIGAEVAKQVVKIFKDVKLSCFVYIFTQDKCAAKSVIEKIGFGGGCINDTLIHLATSEMPFGGFGESGMGSYHAMLDDDAAEFLSDAANGDARAALNGIELAVLTTDRSDDGMIHITIGRGSCFAYF